MKEKIEAAIRETLVIHNKRSIYIAVEKIMQIVEKDKTKCPICNGKGEFEALVMGTDSEIVKCECKTITQ